jgi:N-acetylmuramoyl-L-alanine amidase
MEPTPARPSHPKSTALAKAVHPKYVKAFGLKDRGIKTKNLHMLREFKGEFKAAILTEGGYMDSSIDIKHLRSNTRLNAQGKAIAQGIAEFLGAKRTAVTIKVETSAAPKVEPKEGVKVATTDADKYVSADRSFIGAQEFVKAKGISDGTYPHRTMTRQEAFSMMERLYNAIKEGK